MITLSDMEPASEEIPVLERTNQELSASRAHDLLQDTENAAALPPINPLGGTVFLYYNPGKEGERTGPYLMYWSGPVGPFWSENYTRP